MKRLFLFLACLVTLPVFGQGLFTSWNRFALLATPTSCANPPALPAISGLIWHLDASLNITNDSNAAPADGETIKVWKDEANSQTFQQGYVPWQPTYRTGGPNGKPFVDITGNPLARLCMTNYNGVTYGQTNTVFFVVSNAMPDIAGGFELLDSGPGNRSLLQSVGPVASLAYQIFAGTLLAGPTSQVPSGWHVLSAQWTGNNSQIRTNGAVLKAGAAGASAFTGFILFAYQPNVQSGFSGQCAEGIFYSGPMTATQMLDVERYLMWKYCIPNVP